MIRKTATSTNETIHIETCGGDLGGGFLSSGGSRAYTCVMLGPVFGGICGSGGDIMAPFNDEPFVDAAIEGV